jgi:two-component system sensor histidine kinase UhpB
MMVIAVVVTIISARNDIDHEAAASEKVGELLSILADFQTEVALSEQVLKIDALNQSDTLRHFHIALLDTSGKRLTQSPKETDTSTPDWIKNLLVRDAKLATTSLPIIRSNGERITIMLEPNPYSESTEAISSALLFLGLFAALGMALIVAIWVSVKLAFKPLSDILAGITRIESGDYKLQLATSSTRELNQIAQALNHLAAVLTEQIAKQRELLHRLQDVQEEERRKLAHELHDEFGQLLTALQVDASYVLKQSVNQPELLACAQAMYDNSSSILSQLRNLLAQLRPYGLQGDEEHDIALEQALRDLVRQRQSRGDAALVCNLNVNLRSTVIPQRLAVAVYRIAQEALTNVMRHAQAKQVDIQVNVDADKHQLCLRVADDGVGLQEQSVIDSQTQTHNQASRGLGLVGMRERILANQGTLQFITTQPHGLIVEAIFPLALVEGQTKHD